LQTAELRRSPDAAQHESMAEKLEPHVIATSTTGGRAKKRPRCELELTREGKEVRETGLTLSGLDLEDIDLSHPVAR
jgi:hypothetical protein